MKTITLMCAILWVITTLFYLYGATLGDYVITDLWIESPVDAVESFVWLVTGCVTAVFFFVLWTKQN